MNQCFFFLQNCFLGVNLKADPMFTTCSVQYVFSLGSLQFGRNKSELQQVKSREYILVQILFNFNSMGVSKSNEKGLYPTEHEQGVCHIVALPFTLKRILRQKKNCQNSNISPCKNIIFKKYSKRNQNPSRYYNSIITNLKFQHKPKYHLSKILM